jgi:hypothetical protein
MYGKEKNACRILMGRVRGRRPLGRPKRRWKDSVKIDLREVEYGIDLSQNMGHWRALVNTVINLLVHKMVVNSWVTERLELVT